MVMQQIVFAVLFLQTHVFSVAAKYGSHDARNKEMEWAVVAS